MNQTTPLPSGNDNTYDSSELVIFDSELMPGPFEEPSLPPEISIDAVRLAGRLASHNLPEPQRTLIRMMLDGNSKQEIAKELHVSFPQLFYLWRDAYRATKNALECLPEITPDLRQWTIVKITHFASAK